MITRLSFHVPSDLTTRSPVMQIIRQEASPSGNDWTIGCDAMLIHESLDGRLDKDLVSSLRCNLARDDGRFDGKKL